MDDFERNENESEVNRTSETNEPEESRTADDSFERSFREEEKPKKKKRSKKPLMITLAAVGTAAVLVLTSVVAVNSITKAVRERFPAVQSEASDNGKAELSTAEVKPDTTANGNSQVTAASLSKADQKPLATTDTSAKVTLMDVSDVVNNVMPSVVAITDNLEVTQQMNPYSYYFGGSSQSQTTTKETAASGSGVIIAQNDSELLIVTNNHVIDNDGNYSYYSLKSTGLTVAFSDGSTAPATVKGTNTDMDLAVLSVSLSDLTQETKDAIRIAVVGSSDDLQVGEGVIAIGNALGYGQSVTAGIVSALDREVTIDNNTRTLLQTDAAINPGNSGGGLFNANGELIGINSAKYSDSSVEGMGFAIPISHAEQIITELMNRETVPESEKGYLGVNGETVPSTYVNQYGYPAGVSITRIGEGSPAEKGGLQIYDIVTKVDDTEVQSMEGLKQEVNSHAAGDTITLTVMRPEGRGFTEVTLSVTLVRYDDLTMSQTEAATQSDNSSVQDWFGK